MLEAPEKILFQFVKPFLPAKPVIFDVGAHKGSYTEYVLSEMPDADCFLFEPNKYLCGFLKSKHKAFNTLVGATSGPKDFYECEGKWDELSSMYKRPVFHGLPVSTGKVGCITIDQFCADMSINHIDLLKIDVEGAELDVLEGSGKMLSDKKIPFLQVEYGGTYPDAGITGLQAIQYLNELGYKVYELSGDELELVAPENFVEDYRYTNFFGNVQRNDMSTEIVVGDYITNKPNVHWLETYFKNGPLKCIRIDDGPEYAGGKFIIVDWAGTEQGFYLNAVKKV